MRKPPRLFLLLLFLGFGFLSLLALIAGGAAFFRYLALEHRYTQEGKEYTAQKNYPKAIEAYTALINMHSKSFAAYSGRALAYYDSGRYREAVSDYTQAIAVSHFDKNKVTCYVSRGLAYEAQRKWGSAVEDFTAAIAIDPKRWNAYRLRGHDYSKLKRSNEALDDVNKAVELKPDAAECYGTRAVINAESGQKTMAIVDCRKAAELNSASCIVWNNAGWAMYKVGEIPDAIRYDRRALKLNPEHTMTRFNLAACLALQNNSAEAKKEYTQAIDDGQIWLQRGALREMLQIQAKYPNNTAIHESIRLLANAKPAAPQKKLPTDTRNVNAE